MLAVNVMSSDSWVTWLFFLQMMLIMPVMPVMVAWEYLWFEMNVAVCVRGLDGCLEGIFVTRIFVTRELILEVTSRTAMSLSWLP